MESGHAQSALAACCGQRCGELRPSIESVRALASFHLHELTGDRNAFALGKPNYCRSLTFQAET
jgi:hypothetical protein